MKDPLLYLSVVHGVHRMPDLDAMVIKYFLDALVKRVKLVPDDSQKYIQWAPKDALKFVKLGTYDVPYCSLILRRAWRVEEGHSRAETLVLRQVIPFGCPTMNRWVSVCHNTGAKTRAVALMHQLVNLSVDARGCASKLGPGPTEIIQKLPNGIRVCDQQGTQLWTRPATARAFTERYFKQVLGRTKIHTSVTKLMEWS